MDQKEDLQFGWTFFQILYNIEYSMNEEEQVTPQAQQIGQDLQFVRDAVSKRADRHRMPSIIGVFWASYVLVGYPLLDFKPNFGAMFLMSASIAGGILSAWLGRRDAVRRGERDDAEGRREGAHWLSLLVAIIAVLALSIIHRVDGTLTGQYVTLMVGVVYFLAGVHYDRKFVWLGLLMMAGTIGISFVPRYPWTALGVLMGSGLLIASFLNRRPLADNA
jgi:hypothetical protein